MRPRIRALAGQYPGCCQRFIQCRQGISEQDSKSDTSLKFRKSTRESVLLHLLHDFLVQCADFMHNFTNGIFLLAARVQHGPGNFESVNEDARIEGRRKNNQCQCGHKIQSEMQEA